MDYTMKEKYNYFKKCANTGVNGAGEKLDFISRARYANCALRQQTKLNRFMGTATFVQTNMKKTPKK